MLELGKKLALLGFASILFTGCALFDEDTPVPERLFPGANNSTEDAGSDDAGADAGPVDAGRLDAGQSDSGEAEDVGVDADVGSNADMGTAGPWSCQPIELATDALAIGEIQIEPLSDGHFIATWSTAAGSQTVEVFGADGVVVDAVTYTDLIQRPQRIELLTDGGDAYSVAVARNAGLRIERCMQVGECAGSGSPSGVVGGLDGAWNGGEQFPYLQILQDTALRTVAVASGEPTTMLVNETADWMSLALTDIPSDPMLTTSTSVVFVNGGAVHVGVRPTSGTPISVTPQDCGIESGAVGKVVALPEEGDFVADVRASGDQALERSTCGVSRTPITEPLIGPSDWAVVQSAGNLLSFYADLNGLSAATYDGAIQTYSVATTEVTLVDATIGPAGDVAILTVDPDGIVELRRMTIQGECL